MPLLFDHHNEHVDDQMVLVQANIDDMNPEYSSYVTERLFEAGANDVYWVPIIMKKGRPGLMLNVLAAAERLEQMEDVIFTETTTLGLRYLQANVHRLGREFVQADTQWGTVSVKLGYYKGKLVQAAPEFKECEAIAKRHGVPLKLVYEEVRRTCAGLKPPAADT
ncbi:nickel insertion protein [Paenibacillus oceani]|nr:nickel insertion protein [Paenibacillus oceani]